jgi:hypothetical protein
MACNVTQSDLAHFYGTQKIYKHWLCLVYTDGINYLCNNGAAWLIDAIASHQGNPGLHTVRMQEYQLWELKVNDGSAVLTCREDSGIDPVITQEIPYTDFPFDIKIYVENGTILLPSER